MSDHHEIFTQFFLDPEVIFSSHTMFIIGPTKEFTLTHLVTFSISRMEFYFVYSLIRLWTKLIVKYKVATCHFIHIYIYIYIQ